MRHHLALVACLAFTGSLAHAAPGRHAGRHGKVGKKAKHKAKVVPPAEQPDASDEERSDDDNNDTADADDESEAPRRTKRSKHKRARIVHAREEAESDSGRVAFGGEATNDDVVVDNQDAVDDDRAKVLDPPVRLRKSAEKARPNSWHVAIGPYLWASSVDANVSLGPASVSSGVDFFEVQRHARYGAEVLAEARYGRFSIYGDVMYGVVAVDGAKEVGPLMVTLNGTASSLLADGTAGYLLAGGDQSLLSLEALAGVRYQRTVIAGSVNVAGVDVSPPAQVDAAADALAGAHVVVRPFRRFSFSGTFDLGVFGASTSTWSASADASARVSKHVLLSLGWRTLTTERPNVSIVMHGPRAAVQLMF
ncbi:MAG TPA: hypothetical protein VN253_10540 [Kofleriaceae bacterium]|nr:hypothetical protein [Kofleriaceae bacterium]